ncbi:uncharacterized protein [Amphiura filiformis]|uniref:uncharacterized protein isoform X2 n=1 Tax=Amphiura filiformis TaxID=82378 RepID=UPI003B21025B
MQSSGVVAISTTAVTPTDIVLMPEIPLFGEHSSQSSIGFGGTPALAVDGNTDGDYFHGSCTHTVDGNNSAWWAVDMQQLYCVGRVVIYNRNDCFMSECYGDRLDGAIIRAGNDSNTLNNPVFGRVDATAGDVIQLTCGLVGRFISVHNNQDIHICELKAYAGDCKTTREQDFICDDGLTSIPNCVRCDAEAYCTDGTDEIDCAGSTANEATTIGTKPTQAADGSALTSPIIGATTAGVGILVIVLVIGVVIYCKRRNNPEVLETPECEPYATYRPPTDDSSQDPSIDISGPEHPGHPPVPYYTHVPSPDNSSQHPPIDTSGPELPGHLPVSYSTYVPDNSSAHPQVDASDYEIPKY